MISSNIAPNNTGFAKRNQGAPLKVGSGYIVF
jgi:hypothetical protein